MGNDGDASEESHYTTGVRRSRAVVYVPIREALFRIGNVPLLGKRQHVLHALPDSSFNLLEIEIPTVMHVVLRSA